MPRSTGSMTSASPSERRDAEPEGEVGGRRDPEDIGRVEAFGRIDPVAERAAGHDAEAEHVGDGVAERAGDRGPAVGDGARRDRAHGEHVEDGERAKSSSP